MKTHELDIRSVLDIPEWEKVQDEFARRTGTAIVAVDYKGAPVSKYSGCTDFCSVIRKDPVAAERCGKCDALAGLEAVRRNRPFLYLCHCGIVEAAVPVTAGDRYLGAVICGQVRLPHAGAGARVERLVHEISFPRSEAAAARRALTEKYDRLPELEYRRIEAIAAMLDAVVRYIAGRTRKGRSASPRLTESAAAPTDVPGSSPVYPAVSYIERNGREMPGMKDMAALCHLSPSYFSKVFLKETGENYTDYLGRKKVERAKEALRNSNSHVNTIAMYLGYQDTSYFVKVFKKYEGVTPTEYRKSERKG